MNVYDKLRELDLQLPDPPKAGGLYQTAVIHDNGRMCSTSGHNCKVNGELPRTGKVGREVSLEEGQEDARQCILNILGTLHAALGDLNRIRRVVKILGFVASDDSFNEQPKVLNGASQLLIDLFGEERGKGARSAVGVNVLPNNQPVEIEIVCELYEA